MSRVGPVTRCPGPVCKETQEARGLQRVWRTHCASLGEPHRHHRQNLTARAGRG